MLRRQTWIVLGLFLVSLVAVYFLRREADDLQVTETPPVEDLGYFFAAQGNAVNMITITSADGRKVSAERNAENNGVWQLLEPVGEADAMRIDDAALGAEGLRVVSVMENPPAAEAAGLEPPAYTVELRFMDGQTQVARVGKPTPTQNGYYAMLEGGPVVIVGKYDFERLLSILNTPPLLITADVGETGAPGAESTPAP